MLFSKILRLWRAIDPLTPSPGGSTLATEPRLRGDRLATLKVAIRYLDLFPSFSCIKWTTSLLIIKLEITISPFTIPNYYGLRP